MAFLPAFTLPFVCAAKNSPTPTPPVSRRRAPSQLTPFAVGPSTNTSYLPTHLQLARVRFHLLRASRAEANANNQNQTSASDNTRANPPSSNQSKRRRRRGFSDEECKARSERLKAKWADPEWRAAMLEKRRGMETVSRMKESARKLWKDPEHRARMRAARLGRPAPNKGVAASSVTRLRMSVAKKGVVFSEERKKRMSLAKLNRPEGDDWPRLISESRKGKTKEYFQMRREFRALHRDLRLWSDSYRAKYGRLPSASTYESYAAPMMVFRIKRYLMLRDAVGGDEPQVNRDIISKQ